MDGYLCLCLYGPFRVDPEVNAFFSSSSSSFFSSSTTGVRDYESAKLVERSKRPFDRFVLMDVPLFPTPPTFGGAATTLAISDVYNVVPSDVVTHRSRKPLSERKRERERHAAAAVTAASPSKVRATPSLRGKGYRLRLSRNLVHPRRTIAKEARRRFARFRLRMTDRPENDQEEKDDDDVVICAPSSNVPTEAPPTWIKTNVRRVKSTRSVALQTAVRIPLRLRVLPSLREIADENDPASANSKSSVIWKHLRFLGRLSLSQFGRNSNRWLSSNDPLLSIKMLFD